jgi:hypothetical protein
MVTVHMYMSFTYFLAGAMQDWRQGQQQQASHLNCIEALTHAVEREQEARYRSEII